MKKCLLFLLIVAFTVLLAACSSDSASPPKEDPKDRTESVLVEKSNALLAYLENHDWEALTKEVNLDGLIFTLFANLGGSNEASFNVEDLLTESEEEFVWGKDLADREIVATKDDSWRISDDVLYSRLKRRKIIRYAQDSESILM